MANSMGSLYIGVSGLQTSQNALNMTANNLANVDTEGYVRERILQQDRNYVTMNMTTAVSYQQSGLGVSIGDVIHARDIFLDKMYRTQNGRSGFYSTTFETISEVQTLFQELEGTAFQEVLTGDDGLWVAFQEFAKDPSDSSRQNLVIQKASLFASRSKAVYNGLKTYQSNLNLQISDAIKDINDLGSTIRDLNLQTMKIEAGGIETAMNLRDVRDTALDKLSTYGNISYKELGNGTVKVNFEGALFVDESHFYEMGMKTEQDTHFITPYWPHLSDLSKDRYYKVYNMAEEISPARKNDIGSLKALLFARGDKNANYRDLDGVSLQEYDDTLGNSVMMNVEAELDMLVHTIVTKVNDLLAPNINLTAAITGTDENGNVVTLQPGTKILDTENCCVGADGSLPPQELFVRVGCKRYTEVTGDDGKTYYVYNEEDPSDTAKQYTTGSISVNQKLLESESLLPSYMQNGKDGERPVAYKLGEALAKVWEDDTMFLSPHDTTPCNFSGFYAKMIGELGTLGDVFGSTASGLEGTALATDNARQQVIGVSSDEELTNMIKFQNAYNASSRFINVVDEMIETIINRLG